MVVIRVSLEYSGFRIQHSGLRRRRQAWFFYAEEIEVLLNYGNIIPHFKCTRKYMLKLLDK